MPRTHLSARKKKKNNAILPSDSNDTSDNEKWPRRQHDSAFACEKVSFVRAPPKELGGLYTLGYKQPPIVGQSLNREADVGMSSYG